MKNIKSITENKPQTEVTTEELRSGFVGFKSLDGGYGYLVFKYSTFEIVFAPALSGSPTNNYDVFIGKNFVDNFDYFSNFDFFYFTNRKEFYQWVLDKSN